MSIMEPIPAHKCPNDSFHKLLEYSRLQRTFFVACVTKNVSDRGDGLTSSYERIPIRRRRATAAIPKPAMIRGVHVASGITAVCAVC
jgi:hypothetical protein